MIIYWLSLRLWSGGQVVDARWNATLIRLQPVSFQLHKRGLGVKVEEGSIFAMSECVGWLAGG